VSLKKLSIVCGVASLVLRDVAFAQELSVSTRDSGLPQAEGNSYEQASHYGGRQRQPSPYNCPPMDSHCALAYREQTGGSGCATCSAVPDHQGAYTRWRLVALGGTVLLLVKQLRSRRRALTRVAAESA
jgi:hypothetical protein